MADNNTRSKREKECSGCGNTLRFGGYSPSGKEEWYHADSLTEIDCPFVL